MEFVFKNKVFFSVLWESLDEKVCFLFSQFSLLVCWQWGWVSNQFENSLGRPKLVKNLPGGDTDTHKANESQRKRRAKQMLDYPETAFWLPFFSVIIKKKNHVHYHHWCASISCGVITGLWEHISSSILRIEINFPQQRKVKGVRGRRRPKRQRGGRHVDVQVGLLLVTEAAG